ncbi:MAG: type II toxin-antitoxin system VapC family toxin [Lentisphaerae bacterium]|jgi:PIN domain nuclease of toxin-antitoxin system|nr:type II toxin-antitoxin system VapC family toxin [Lentisphaerota bacterium]MBT4816636.1 type II toxin-antitoxin system VapC family toxin [Lentisphaerota bacterium]MBT5606397.1 type II toxin-antitoxin system VapC family toxin [Lentisphaerota bacterium]MBT7059751.1 type II toxin-antitoxin system VapC family toxin [Lentisphaerota bacterium]MBT7847871.1 type II toxin-antitoxin system VapC family toxin [Lentisphaerota bacterium]
MRYLLDTHTLLWFLQGASQLPDAVAERIEAPQAETWISMASVWEMAIKTGLGKLRVPYSLDKELPDLLEQNGFAVLNFGFDHLAAVSQLPFHHRDPFDRLLVSQALVEGLTLISCDSAMDAYGVQRTWA